MDSLQKRTMLILGMTFTLIVIMIYGNNKNEVRSKPSNSALSLDFLIRSDVGSKPKSSLEDGGVILTLGLTESAKQSLFVEQFVRSVKEKSKGKIVIEPHLISQDVTEQPLTEVINGDVDIVLTDLTEVGAMIPELAFLQSPGLFNDVAEMNKIWTSEMGDYLRSKALKKEFTLAAFEISGFSHFLTAQPIAHFEEVQNNMVGIPEKGFDGLLLERLDLNTRMVEPEQILPAVADGVIPTYSATMEQMASSNVKFAAKISSAG